jgi:multiple sugar transport system ATP-binding protein
MAGVVLRNIVKRYGTVLAVDALNLECRDREFLAILGPSGCGKSSTMRMIAGLEQVTEGKIHFDDRDVTGLPPAKRNVAMAFENYGLYPHMSVFDNIAYPLKIRHFSRKQIVDRVLQVASILHIERLLEERPAALSGGVQQRVSLARALVRNPAVFLLDEPISHIDAELRNSMRLEIKRLHTANQSTMIYVTHDQLEALSMADRVAVMNHGVLQQHGTPNDILRAPANKFVATFVGEPPMNIFASQTINQYGRSVVTVEGVVLDQIVLPDHLATAKEVEVGLRPDDVLIATNDATGLSGVVRIRETLGDTSLTTVDTKTHRVRIRHNSRIRIAKGDHVKLTFRNGGAHLFDSQTGRALPQARFSQTS